MSEETNFVMKGMGPSLQLQLDSVQLMYKIVLSYNLLN